MSENKNQEETYIDLSENEFFLLEKPLYLKIRERARCLAAFKGNALRHFHGLIIEPRLYHASRYIDHLYNNAVKWIENQHMEGCTVWMIFYDGEKIYNPRPLPGYGDENNPLALRVRPNSLDTFIRDEIHHCEAKNLFG